MIDELLQEQASLYVFDLLDTAEKAAFEARMRTDAELRALVDDLREAAAAVSHASPRRELPADFEQRVLAAIDESEKIIPFKQPVPWLPWAIAAGLAVASALLYFDLHETRQTLAGIQVDLAGTHNALTQTQNALVESQNALTASRHSLTQAQNDMASIEAQLSGSQKIQPAPNLKVAELVSTAKTASKANAVVVWDGTNQRGLVRLNDVPGVESGKDYQLWVIDPAYKAPVSAGVIHADAQRGAVEFRATMPIRDAQKFAISVEKAGGSTEPGGPIVFISD